jgi:cobalt/nickel transport system permease protein
MHMADALISPAVGAGFYAASSATLAWSSWRLRLQPDTRVVPTMGVLGAFVFAAQMINFAIPGTGSSGHLAGGMLLAAVLGPAPAFLVMTSVLLVQCLFFADGGLLALGANVFNLGFFPCFVGYPLFRRIAGRSPTPARRSWGLALGALVSVELGALSVALQTVASGRTDLAFGSFAGLMAAIHLPIGVVEGLVTASAAALLWRLRPGLDASEPPAAENGRAWRRAVAAVGLVAVLTAACLAWFASTRPDGLEWSLERQGDVAASAAAGEAETRARESATTSWPEVDGGTSLAGLYGAGLVLVVAVALGLPPLVLRWRREQAARRRS